MDGGESISEDGETICLGGKGDGGDDKCDGFDSNGTPESIYKWRALKHIPYIQNDDQSAQAGYLNRYGTLIPQQE